MPLLLVVKHLRWDQSSTSVSVERVTHLLVMSSAAAAAAAAVYSVHLANLLG